MRRKYLDTQKVLTRFKGACSAAKWSGKTMLICQVLKMSEGIQRNSIKFIYSEKATKVFKIFTLPLTLCTEVRSKVKISQNFVAFSEYMNFKAALFMSGKPWFTPNQPTESKLLNKSHLLISILKWNFSNNRWRSNRTFP